MSSFGSQMRKRLNELRKAGQNVPKIIHDVAKEATIAAVEAATKATPPNGGAPIAGTNTRKGNLAEHWTTDSKIEPVNGVTVLANEAKDDRGEQYASYVNDGHRVDKHFVPGLHIVGDHLNYDAGIKGGIVVGTKTTYVPGLYMKEKGIAKYRTVVRKELDKRVREAFK